MDSLHSWKVSFYFWSQVTIPGYLELECSRKYLCPTFKIFSRNCLELVNQVIKFQLTLKKFVLFRRDSLEILALGSRNLRPNSKLVVHELFTQIGPCLKKKLQISLRIIFFICLIIGIVLHQLSKQNYRKCFPFF